MKWTRSKDHIQEYSNGYIGLRHYISMTHKADTDNYHYTYTNNGSLICFGDIKTDNWDDAEQIVIKRIKSYLFDMVKYYNQMQTDFNIGVISNEVVD